MVALRRDSIFATEAGIKYALLSAYASLICIFGIGFIYGMFGYDKYFEFVLVII